jgi:hypothetical protein
MKNENTNENVKNEKKNNTASNAHPHCPLSVLNCLNTINIGFIKYAPYDNLENGTQKS